MDDKPVDYFSIKLNCKLLRERLPFDYACAISEVGTSDAAELLFGDGF